MAKDPREQQETDANRIPEKGTGKTDADVARLSEQDRLKKNQPRQTGRDQASGDEARNSDLSGSEPAGNEP